MLSSYSSTQSCPIAELTRALLPLAVVELPSSSGTKNCLLGVLSLGKFVGQKDLTHLSVLLML